jgi:hypothetical protein
LIVLQQSLLNPHGCHLTCDPGCWIGHRPLVVRGAVGTSCSRSGSGGARTRAAGYDRVLDATNQCCSEFRAIVEAKWNSGPAARQSGPQGGQQVRPAHPQRARPAVPFNGTGPTTAGAEIGRWTWGEVGRGRVRACS